MITSAVSAAYVPLHHSKFYSILCFSTTLCRQLFSANEVLQGCLLHVRGLCEAASGSLNGVGVGQAAISLIDLNKNSTITLPEVMDMQEKQTEKAYHQLKALRKTVIDIVWESCAVSVRFVILIILF